MALPQACPRCGASRIIERASVIDNGLAGNDDTYVRVGPKLGSKFSKSSHDEKLLARVCGDCGYTELYAQNPQVLWAFHQRTSEEA